METKEAPKRKYKKHKKDIKITLKHFINKRVKNINIYEKESCPLYVQITLKRKTTAYRSKLDISSNSEEMYLIEQEYGMALKREIKNIKYFINEFNPIGNDNFSLSSVMVLYRTQKSLVSHVNSVLVRELTTAINKNLSSFEGVLSSDNILEELDALVLYDRFKELEDVKSIKSELGEQIFWLPYYYQVFCRNLQFRFYQREFVYHILEPTVLDYLEGGFREELEDFFTESKISVSQLLSSIDALLEKN